MTTGIFGLNESVTAAFLWEDADGAPLTALSPAPTVAVTNPNGVVTAPSLTQRGSTGYWDVTITPDSNASPARKNLGNVGLAMSGRLVVTRFSAKPNRSSADATTAITR